MKAVALSLPAASRMRSVLVLLALAACALVSYLAIGAHPSRMSSAGSSAEVHAPAAERSRVEGTVMSQALPAADRSSAKALAAAAPADAAIARRIITTGEIAVDVRDVAAAARQLEALVTGAGGWIANRESGADGDGRRTASFVVRVPAARFDAIYDRLAALGDVTHDAKQTQDVGKTFVDLEARRRNLQREEAVIAGLFARNGRIADVLEVERELARVRGEIEQAEGELRYLGNQESYSTLTITLAPLRPAIQRRVETWDLAYHATRATRALLGAMRTVTTVLLYGAIVVGPFALVIAAAAWAVRRARRRLAPQAGARG